MKKIALTMTAATIAIASTAVSAWGWNDNGYNNGWGDGFGDGDFDGGFSMNFSGRASGRGHGRGYNSYNGYNGYGPSYGYAPYGYGAPVAPIAPAVEMTEEQKKAIADQQAQITENMQKAQEQAAARLKPCRRLSSRLSPVRNHADAAC